MKTANYTEKEKIILASFVREMGGEIENKKTDATSVQKKQDAWEKIAAHYSVFLLLFSFCQLCFTISQLIFPFILLVRDDL
jgi:fatty acid-binding protein DegV